MILDYLFNNSARYRRWRGGYWELEQHREYGCFWSRVEDFTPRTESRWRFYGRVIKREDHSRPRRALPPARPAVFDEVERARELRVWNANRFPDGYTVTGRGGARLPEVSRIELLSLLPSATTPEERAEVERFEEVYAWHANAPRKSRRGVLERRGGWAHAIEGSIYASRFVSRFSDQLRSREEIKLFDRADAVEAWNSIALDPAGP